MILEEGYYRGRPVFVSEDERARPSFALRVGLKASHTAPRVGDGEEVGADHDPVYLRLPLIYADDAEIYDRQTRAKRAATMADSQAAFEEALAHFPAWKDYAAANRGKQEVLFWPFDHEDEFRETEVYFRVVHKQGADGVVYANAWLFTPHSDGGGEGRVLDRAEVESAHGKTLKAILHAMDFGEAAKPAAPASAPRGAAKSEARTAAAKPAKPAKAAKPARKSTLEECWSAWHAIEPDDGGDMFYAFAASVVGREDDETYGAEEWGEVNAAIAEKAANNPPL